MKNIYLDYAASTPLDPDVIAAMQSHFTDVIGNASSVHRFGQKLKNTIEESRAIIAQSINAHPSEIVFVSGGTEADNFALIGMMKSLRAKNKTHIITSQIEHRAVLDTCEYLANNGFTISYCSPEKDGIVTLASVQQLLRKETGLISIMHVNNELGTINPIEDIGKFAKLNNIIFHTDAVQSFGKCPIDVNIMNVDLLSASAHKIYGPKGIGFLFIRRGVDIEPIIHGGGQERGRRAGTESVPHIVGFAKAIQKMVQNYSSEFERNTFLKNLLVSKLKESITNYFLDTSLILNGNQKKSIPNILNISFDTSLFEIDGEMLVLNLDIAGIAVANGSACSSGSIEPSHVLLALGRDKKTAKASMRFSFGRWTTDEEIEYAVLTVQKILNRIAVKKERHE
jgi:cysteine desulfurase